MHAIVRLDYSTGTDARGFSRGHFNRAFLRGPNSMGLRPMGRRKHADRDVHHVARPSVDVHLAVTVPLPCEMPSGGLAPVQMPGPHGRWCRGIAVDSLFVTAGKDFLCGPGALGNVARGACEPVSIPMEWSLAAARSRRLPGLERGQGAASQEASKFLRRLQKMHADARRWNRITGLPAGPAGRRSVVPSLLRHIFQPVSICIANARNHRSLL